MLLIERFLKESVVIEGPCKVTVHRIKGSRRVQLAIEADKSVRILRGELCGKSQSTDTRGAGE